MKTIRLFTFFAAAGALLVSASSAYAESALRLDTFGHLTAPLDLGDTHVTGTLDAARLPNDAAFHTLSISNQTLFAGPISFPVNQPITLAGSDISGSILTVGAGGVFTPQTLPAGHSLRRNSANTAFEDYAPNTGDGSALTNLNASALSTGTVAPARLGSGTPTSGTVLRGDGTWAGTTPTGNTVAATGNLLMGDGAGNAVPISNGTDLLRLLQARGDTARSVVSPATNLLNNSLLVLRNATLNADGTLTIPANDYLYFNDPGDANYGSNKGLMHYAYVVATSDAPRGGLALAAYYGGYQAVDQSNVQTYPLPGVVRTTFINATGAGGYSTYITNTTAAALTIYFPFVSLVDPGHPVFASGADIATVPAQPVTDLDFTKFASADRSARYQLEQRTTTAADSVNGAAGNAGTLYAPKLALPLTLPNPGGVLGLYRGSLFQGSLPLSALGTTHGIVVQDVALGSVKPLPVISALDPAVNGSFSSNGDGTYSIQWTPTEALTNDGYANVYVVEVNTLTEALTPVASRRRLIDAASPAAVVSTPGSAYVSAFGGNGWLAQVHPTDGLAPGSGSYRYEVVSRVQPANWGSFAANAGDGAMSGVMLTGGSAGYGSLGGPPGFVGDRLVVLHASSHNAVLGGGSLQRSVFYEAGNLAQSIQLAWYAGAGAGLRWDLRHCLFYANVGDRVANGLIAHTGGSAYDRGDLSDTAFLGSRWSDGSLHGQAIDYVNVAAGVIERVYVQGVFDAFSYNMPLAIEVKSSVFRQVNQLRCGTNFHDNLVLAESASDPTTVAHRAPTACLFQQSGASATNNLFWARGLASGLPNDGGAGGINFYPGALTHCTFARNVLVLNPATASEVTYLNPNGSDLSTLAIDDNLVINLSRGGFSAAVGGPAAKKSWADYVAYEATQANPLDQHSLYVDLSSDPRGLQAVFVDPLNGDLRWAQTDVGAQCAAYCQAHHAGPARVSTRWPLVPTVDEAVRLLTDL